MPVVRPATGVVAGVVAGIVLVGVSVWTVFGRADWWPAVAVAGALVVAVAAQTGGAITWRRPLAVGLGAVVAASIVLVTRGRPAADVTIEVLIGMIAAAAAAVVATRVIAVRHQVGAASGTVESLDEVVARMTRPLPLDELLQQVVDTLRNTPESRAVELWQVRRDHLVVTHCRPLVDRPIVPIDERAAAVVATAGIVGDAWLRTWLPDVVTAPDGDSTRMAPLAAHGELLGALVLRRASGLAPLGPDDDRRLAQLQRPVAAALNQARLTDALGETVVELRQRNAELQESRTRLVAVADAERRRLERDLHDGAQAHLTALQVKLQMLSITTEHSPERVGTLLAEVHADLATATAELRSVAHGLVPPQLVAGGLGDALREAASRCPRPVTVDVSTRRRFRPELEAAVYYCCVEALQNVVKHAGPDASAVIGVSADDEVVCFSVADDGVGMLADRPGRGQGLVNMTDRIGALGGRVGVGAGAGGGVRVAGQVPVDPAPLEPVTDQSPSERATSDR